MEKKGIVRTIIRGLLPRAFRHHRIWSGPLRGERLVTSVHDYPSAVFGYGERPLLHWLLINAKPGETWLDVGAHYGLTSLAMCRAVGRSGRVFAFEPNLISVGCLSRTKEKNRLRQWTISPFALGDERGFSLKSLPTVRGMIDNQIALEDADGVEQLFSVALKDVWESLSGDNQKLDGIKMDVQGAELEALSGMRPLLEMWKPKLVLEVHPGVSRKAIVDLLKTCGYSEEMMAIERPAEDFWDESGNQSYVFIAPSMVTQAPTNVRE